MNSEDYSSRALWFVAGAAVGATLALLFAPASGDVTRRRIRRAAEDGKDRISEAGRDLMERGRDLYEKGKQVADDAASLFERGRKLVEG
jgi:gas vesicle protein